MINQVDLIISSIIVSLATHKQSTFIFNKNIRFRKKKDTWKSLSHLYFKVTGGYDETFMMVIVMVIVMPIMIKSYNLLALLLIISSNWSRYSLIFCSTMMRSCLCDLFLRFFFVQVQLMSNLYCHVLSLSSTEEWRNRTERTIGERSDWGYIQIVWSGPLSIFNTESENNLICSMYEIMSCGSWHGKNIPTVICTKILVLEGTYLVIYHKSTFLF